MTVTRNDCCDCAAPSYPCVHCCVDYQVEICDTCGEDENETQLYQIGDKVLCGECVLKNLPKCENTHTRCCDCDTTTEYDELYFYEGEWYCEDCLNEVLSTSSI